MTDQENNNNISSNPFAALFGSLADAKQFAAIQKEQLKQQSDELPASPDDSDNSVSESLDEFDYSVAEISRSFRSQQEICEQLNINHMIQRIFLITLDNSDPNPLVSSVFHRKRVFCNFPYASHLAEALIKVFVDIEFTGDPHQFEQKFNYRRPMYPILKYMWGTDTYRESIKDLADYASKNLEAMNPPLFLRFLNLLMNDAIFLLDEAIQYLSKIKIQQIEKDRGEWDNLTPEARREKEAGLQMFGQLARFHNIMSNETIGTLAFLTSEIKSLFVHPFLAERIISLWFSSFPFS